MQWYYLTVHHQVADAAGETAVTSMRRCFLHSSHLKRLEDIQIPEEGEVEEEEHEQKVERQRR